MRKNDFVFCGLLGLCLEVFWTGSINLLHHDRFLRANTSLLMFPIYGLGAVIKPVSKKISNIPAIFRGSIYALGIFSVEYLSGSILKSFDRCPWDYKDAKYNVKGLIRLDYAPAWFTVGLLFEKLLNTTDS